MGRRGPDRQPRRGGTDLTGQVFGRLTVVGRATPPISEKSNAARWECVCQCGNRIAAETYLLRRGSVSSCGCLARDETIRRSTKHGLCYTPEYKAWQSMRKRCQNPNDHSYPDYGGRGISVCTEWDQSFERFLADMGPRPSTDHSLDRIEVGGNYEPTNCRWATRIVQQGNRRNVERVEYLGETKAIPEWAHEFGLTPSCLRQRLEKGWDLERALKTPAQK